MKAEFGDEVLFAGQTSPSRVSAQEVYYVHKGRGTVDCGHCVWITFGTLSVGTDFPSVDF